MSIAGSSRDGADYASVATPARTSHPRPSSTDLQQQLGHAELATTQIYASALSARRRAAVMALDFGDTPPVVTSAR